MSNLWITGLKMWNADKSTFSIPKKGTQGYNEIIKIINNLKTDADYGGSKQSDFVKKLIGLDKEDINKVRNPSAWLIAKHARRKEKERAKKERLSMTLEDPTADDRSKKLIILFRKALKEYENPDLHRLPRSKERRALKKLIFQIHDEIKKFDQGEDDDDFKAQEKESRPRRTRTKEPKYTYDSKKFKGFERKTLREMKKLKKLEKELKKPF